MGSVEGEVNVSGIRAGKLRNVAAIGHAKKDYLRLSAGETAYGLMAAIKQVFDPKGILNPGKVCHDLTGGERDA